MELNDIRFDYKFVSNEFCRSFCVDLVVSFVLVEFTKLVFGPICERLPFVIKCCKEGNLVLDHSSSQNLF